MPKVIFIEDFDYKPSPQQTLSYKQGDVVLLKQDVADLVISEEVAELTTESPTAASIADTIKKFPVKKKREEVTEEVIPAEVILEENSLTKEEVLSEKADESIK